jgi:hypothetical protein
MALLLALLVRMCGVNIPINDDFDSPSEMLFDWLQGNFGWYSLWQLHNESRLDVPRMIWLVEAFIAGWSTKPWMYASVAMCAVQAYLLALLLKKTVWNTALIRPVAARQRKNSTCRQQFASLIDASMPNNPATATRPQRRCGRTEALPRGRRA